MTLSSLIEKRFGLPTAAGQSVESNQTLNSILNHRSIRAYTGQPVPDDLLRTLFAAAFSAPSKSDLQQACVIHVQDKVRQQRIAELSSDVTWIAGAPVFLVWCADSRRIRRLSDYRQHPFANDHLDAFMNAAVDVGIAMQTFIIAAESVGLGCCPVSEIRDYINPLSAELNLPQHVFPVAGLCVGYPAEAPDISMRLPLSVTVHTDTYDDSYLIDEVEEYDARREASEPTPPEKQRRTDLYGISDKYGWSENRTRQYGLPARTDFGAYIRAQGFDLS